MTVITNITKTMNTKLELRRFGLIKKRAEELRKTAKMLCTIEEDNYVTIEKGKNLIYKIVEEIGEIMTAETL